MSAVAPARAGMLCACALLLAGCAALASKSDYADYRAVRLTRNEDARLLAMQRYVERHPDGRWFDEVQRERAARDRAVFEARRGDRAGLELYLSAFPDGVFAAQAKSRLAAIAVIEQRKRDEAARAEHLAEERRRREEELSRTWITRFVGYWLRTLLALEGWGSPIEQVARGNPEFARAFGRPPRPRCTLEECSKLYESAYAVPVPGGTRVERAMRLALRLRMNQGKLARAELLLPRSGFARWQELEDKRVVVDGDAEARAAAVEFALARVVPVLSALPGHAPLETNAMPAIAPFRWTGASELTDTTVTDPSAPANRIQGSAPGAAADAPPEQAVMPTPEEPPADMEMDTLHVDRSGRARPAAPGAEMVLDPVPVGPAGAAEPGAGPGQGELVFEPLAVPRGDGAAAPGPSGPQVQPADPASPSAAPSAPTVRAFRAGPLKVVVFAASAADPGGLDGIVIEPAGEGERRQGSPRGKAPAAPRPAEPAAAR